MKYTFWVNVQAIKKWLSRNSRVFIWLCPKTNDGEVTLVELLYWTKAAITFFFDVIQKDIVGESLLSTQIIQHQTIRIRFKRDKIWKINQLLVKTVKHDIALEFSSDDTLAFKRYAVTCQNWDFNVKLKQWKVLFSHSTHLMRRRSKMSDVRCQTLRKIEFEFMMWMKYLVLKCSFD